MKRSWLVLFVALVCTALHDHATEGAFAQIPAPGQPGRLVRGTLSDAKGPVTGRWLVFVATTNRCPDTCSCDGGTCSGGKECEKKLCVLGVITRTNIKGTFGIRLAQDAYDVHLDAPTGKVLAAGVNVGAAGPPIDLKLRLDGVAEGVGAHE